MQIARDSFFFATVHCSLLQDSGRVRSANLRPRGRSGGSAGRASRDLWSLGRYRQEVGLSVIESVVATLVLPKRASNARRQTRSDNQSPRTFSNPFLCPTLRPVSEFRLRSLPSSPAVCSPCGDDTISSPQLRDTFSRTFFHRAGVRGKSQQKSQCKANIENERMTSLF